MSQKLRVDLSELLCELAALQDGAAEVKAIDRELEFGKSAAEKVSNALRTHQEKIARWLPTAIQAGGPEVEADFAEHLKLRSQSSALSGSRAWLQSRRAELHRELGHALPRIEHKVRHKLAAAGGLEATVVFKAGYANSLTKIDQLFARIQGGLLDRIDGLLSVCAEVGIKLPEEGATE